MPALFSLEELKILDILFSQCTCTDELFTKGKIEMNKTRILKLYDDLQPSGLATLFVLLVGIFSSPKWQFLVLPNWTKSIWTPWLYVHIKEHHKGLNLDKILHEYPALQTRNNLFLNTIFFSYTLVLYEPTCRN